MCGITCREWVIGACSQYYYGDELVLYALCRIFHRHAFIICNDRVWTTIKSDVPLTINELLDICDLKLVFLRPGIFGELKLKRKHGKLPPLIVEHSPPEFPAWTDTQPGELSSITYLPNMEATQNTEQSVTETIIKQEVSDTDNNTSAQMPVKVETMEYYNVSATNTPPAISPPTLPLNGGNINC